MKLLAILLLASPCFAGEREMRRFIDAVRRVETGGLPAAGVGAVGDKGASIGPYQIQRGYWLDSRVAGEYRSCLTDAAYSERVMRAYWARYCPRALAAEDWETLARIHNGGPKGAKKSATVKYWERVKKELARP